MGIIALLLRLADWDLKQGKSLSLVCNLPWDLGAQDTTAIHSQEISSMIKQSLKCTCVFLWLRHSRGACPEQQVTFAHNILFYSHYLQAPVASRPGGPWLCWLHPDLFSGLATKQAWSQNRVQSIFNTIPFSFWFMWNYGYKRKRYSGTHSTSHTYWCRSQDNSVYWQSPISKVIPLALMSPVYRSKKFGIVLVHESASSS